VYKLTNYNYFNFNQIYLKLNKIFFIIELQKILCILIIIYIDFYGFILKSFNIFFLIFFIKVFFLFIPILLLIALFTLLERKILGSIQKRRGPNLVGFYGILQPFADAFKLIFKETILPGLSNVILFLGAPIVTFSLSLLN
jgi:hypothetical protein